MSSRPSNRSRRTGSQPKAEEWYSRRWATSSVQKQALIAKRCHDLWGILDERAKKQIWPPEPTKVNLQEGEREDAKDRRASPIHLADVDLMTGAEFERFIGEAFQSKGYEVEHHGGPSEAGGDLVCWERSPNRVHAILVQVKRERCLTGTKAVGQIIRKENWFRLRFPETSYEKWIITSSHFSRQAIKEAEAGSIVLIDRDALKTWLPG